MARGTVKWFHRKKGYGFILSEDGRDVFVHYSVISGDGFKFLDDGEEVDYEYHESDKGLKATNVARLVRA